VTIDDSGSLYLFPVSFAGNVMGNHADNAWECLNATPPVWTRASEASLVESLVDAVARQRAPVSDREADVYRFSAQLLQSHYPQAAAFLDGAARAFYARTGMPPRSFPQVLADKLVSDIARLRNLLERCMGRGKQVECVGSGMSAVKAGAR
jgi:hypothetical protein